MAGAIPFCAAHAAPSAPEKSKPAAEKWAQPAASAKPTTALALPANADPTAVIDQVIQQRWQTEKLTAAPVCSDAVFVRRIYLDLAGRIPTPAETEAFLAECAKENGGKLAAAGGSAQAVAKPASAAPASRVKNTPRARRGRVPTAAANRLLPPAPSVATKARAALVDRLLASPEYADRMKDVFDVVFMGRQNATPGQRRRRGGGGSQAQGLRSEWLSWLERGFAENRPWNQTVEQIALARPTDNKDRGSIYFLYARNNRYQEIAETVSASVLGVQVQCAQCHNHFLVPEIKQKDYWGLVAFFNRSKNQDTKQGPRVAESAIGGFANFATLAGESFPAELTFFDKKIPEMRPAPNQMEMDLPTLYAKKPETMPSDEPAVPLFSRRAEFVEKVLKGNPLVARAAVNRFWELLVGRGFVHPVDKMDSTHPASHPELLDWLAKDFEAHNYDVKRLVRSIVLSRPYQLEVRRKSTVKPEFFTSGFDKPLTAEQLYRSFMVATTGKTDTENGDLERQLVQIFPDVFVEESVSTLRQALYFTNNPTVQKLAEPTPGTTAERLVGMADPAARVREAFKVAYGREPDAEELKAAVQYLTARADRAPQATKQLWWAILTGAEFRFNH